jgi:hypothetical protein
MQIKNKGILVRIYTGVKKGLLTPTLPDHIIKLNNNPIIRLFRVVSGISILLILTKGLSVLGDGLLYFCVLVFCTILAFLFSIYHIFLNYYRIKHIIKVLKSEELDVRNSPLDRVATLIARIIMCSKGVCDAAAPVGLVFGGMAGIDELRKAKGLDPIFLPKLANLIFPDNEFTKQVKEMRLKEAELAYNNSQLNTYKEEYDVVNTFEKNGIISNDEAKT